MQWSEQQEAIFRWFSSETGNLVVRARAGTGKTTTILEGINRAPEDSILLAAFNKSIATELNEKLSNPRAEARTLHSLGFAFVRRNWKRVKVKNGRRAWNLAEDAAETVRSRHKLGPPTDPAISAIKKMHTKAREVNPWASDTGEVLDLAVRFDLLPNEDQGEWDDNALAEAALEAMERAAERTTEIDFADMIFLPLRNRWVKPWYDLVVIDEAQDMTVAQLALARGACRRNGRLAIVGDDRQAIYGFRGADSGSLDRLKAELEAVECGLKTTYRCPQAIVALAQQYVPDFEAAPSAPEGFVTETTRNAIGDDVSEGDFVLSRTNAPLASVCMGLLKRNIRAKIKGRDIGKAITDLVDGLEARDVEDLVDRLERWREQEVRRAQRIKNEDTAQKRTDMVNDQADVIIALLEGATSIAELRTRLEELFSDKIDRRAVMCSTVHKAKGLETDNVYLLADTFRDGKQEEENIRYVAITRSKDMLVWVNNPKE